MRNILYFIDPETTLLVSRVGSEIAIPVLQYDKTYPDHNFKEQFVIEKYDVITVSKWYATLIPINRNKIKKYYIEDWINYHREFWKLKPIPA